MYKCATNSSDFIHKLVIEIWLMWKMKTCGCKIEEQNFSFYCKTSLDVSVESIFT